MPIYSYQCSKCKSTEEIVLPIAKRDSGYLICCGDYMQRIITEPLKAKFIMSDREAAEKVMNDDCLVRNKAVVKSAMKHIEYNRKVF